MNVERPGVRHFAVLLAVFVVVAACGGTTSSSGSKQGTGSLHAQGSNNLLVYFSVIVNNVYVSVAIPAMKAEAAKYGYTVRVLDSNLSQATADANVQTFLASGQKAAAFLWQPPSVDAGAVSAQLLANHAPVVQMSFQPPSAGVSAYAGIDEVQEGVRMGQMALSARQYAQQIGMKLHSPNGNMLIFDFPKGGTAGPARLQGFNSVVTTPFNTIGQVYGAVDPDSGYQLANTAIPQYKSQGIDFIYAFNLQAAQGIVRAAEQYGLTPGKDVLIFAGDCSGSVDNISNGKVYGTVIQPAAVEAKLAVDTALQIIAAGGVKQGTTVTLPVAPQAPPVQVVQPNYITYEGLATMVGAGDLNKMYWGLTYAQTCTG